MLYRLALAAMAGLAAAADWSGSGQIRALDSDDRTTDLGCLTAAGQWTTDESLCGTFTATLQTSSATTVSSTAGNCYIPFQCASGNSVFTYAILEVDGVELLSKADSFTWATTADPDSAPATIDIYGTSDPQPWINLGWKAL